MDSLLSGIGGLKPIINHVEWLGGVIRAKNLILRPRGRQGPHRRPRVSRGPARRPEGAPGDPRGSRTRSTPPKAIARGNSAARGLYATTGASVKVGVTAGRGRFARLPAGHGATCRPWPSCRARPVRGDEGSAMLEIVHDLAPDAQLYFATAKPHSRTSSTWRPPGAPVVGGRRHLPRRVAVRGRPGRPMGQHGHRHRGPVLLVRRQRRRRGRDASGTWEGDFLASAARGTRRLSPERISTISETARTQSCVELGGGGDAPTAADLGRAFRPSRRQRITDLDLSTTWTPASRPSSTRLLDGAGRGRKRKDFPVELHRGRELLGRAPFSSTSSPAGGGGGSDAQPDRLCRGELADALSTSGATRGHRSAAAAFSVAARPAAASFDGVTPAGALPGTLHVSKREREGHVGRPAPRPSWSTTGGEITRRPSTGGVVPQKPDVTAAGRGLLRRSGVCAVLGDSAAGTAPAPPSPLSSSCRPPCRTSARCAAR